MFAFLTVRFFGRREQTAEALATMVSWIVSHEAQAGQAYITRVGKATLPDTHWCYLIETTLGRTRAACTGAPRQWQSTTAPPPRGRVTHRVLLD